MANATDNGYFFESTEKLLEIWFSSENESADLRKIGRSDWEAILDNVHCKILSVKQDDSIMAFLLSESSLFLSKNRFILKTCGRTTLLAAIEPLLKLVKERCGFNKIIDVFYSRKNFLRPDLQDAIHRNFEVEIAHLDDLFGNGAAYALGRINSDCWYLYTTDYIGVIQPDQTLELLMQDLDPEMMKLFSRDNCSSAEMATKKSGISDLIPGTMIDEYLFDPCGYSMNGLLRHGHYFTIHVTPEPEFSYCSFETNIPKESYRSLILKILDIFKPKKFLVTLFANEASITNVKHIESKDFGALTDYQQVDHQFCQLKNYNLTYIMYKSVAPNGWLANGPPH